MAIKKGVFVWDAAANSVSHEFEKRIEKVKAYFFSRNPEYWPVFATDAFKDIVAFRNLNLVPDKRLESYPNGDKLYQQIKSESSVPESLCVPQGRPDEMLSFTGALSKDWENRSSVENVITMPCDPAIYGTMVGSLSNPNLVYSEYSGMADELEKNVIRQMAELAGYNTEKSTGIFTQGGTFCNLYGYLLGIRKSLPVAWKFGMAPAHDYRIINSQGGHYSNITNLSLLGVNIREKTIRLKMEKNNDIDLDDLEQQLTACFQLNCVVPTIMLTMGTTDTFGVDPVKPVYELRNRLCDRFGLATKPHIHVDSAIGWSMLFFLGYDFEKNPLQINEQTLAGIRHNTDRFKELKYADSFTVDFQKWGYVPYTSSLVMIKNSDDLKVLENDPENYSYFEKDLQGQTHMQSTIECSRGAAGVFGAYAALRYMGVEGYRITIAHCLQNANYFRLRLNELGCVKVLVPENQGPSVSFRIYNPDAINDPHAEFNQEFAIQDNDSYRKRLETNNGWHRNLFKKRGKIGLFTNWIEFAVHTAYDEKGQFYHIPGEKAVFMNPRVTRKEIDLFIDNIFRNVCSE